MSRRIPDPPPTMPSPGPLPTGRPAEVRAAEIIAAALLEVAKSVDRLTEAVSSETRHAYPPEP